MVSKIEFPEVPKLPISSDFKSYFEGTKKPSRFDKILSKVFDSTQSEQFSSVGFITRVVSAAFSIKRNSIPKDAPKEVLDAAKEASSIAQTFGDVLTIISGAGAIASLIRNLKKKDVKREDQPIRKLEMMRSTLQIITTGTTFINILDRFKVIQLADITKAMGSIPVIGSGLAQAFPASVVFSGLNIATSALTITISALKLQQIAGRMDRIAAKRKVWERPVNGNLADRKIERIVTKQNDAVKNASELKAKIEQMEATLQTKGQNYEEKKASLEKLEKELATANKVSRFMRTFKQKNALKNAKAEYKKEVKEYKKTSNEMKALEKTHKIRLEKGEKWEAIQEKFNAGTLTEKDSAALEKMRVEKAAKWKTKKVTELVEIAKEVTRIALTLVSIAISITSIALVIIFTGNVPAAALITLAVAGLSLVAVNLIRSFYFNRIKKKPADSVAVPDFRTLKAGA